MDDTRSESIETASRQQSATATATATATTTVTAGATADSAGSMTVEQAVLDADLRVLLLAVAQLSGDRKWLEAPYLPRRDVRLVAPEDAGFDAAIAADIRAAAVAEWHRVHAGGAPAITDPGDELMLEMMSVCLGEDVGAEYSLMFREELGFVSRAVDWPTSAATDGRAVTAEAAEPAEPAGRATPIAVDHDVLVVGAGSSGIALSYRLAELGVEHTVIERAASVGGVWRDNRYPGAGVDTPNHAYSFSFAPPRQWSRFFALQPELEQYLRDTADHFDVTERIEFRTELIGAQWDHQGACWQVDLHTPDGTQRRTCRTLVTATGQLNVPVVPSLPGLDDFTGRAFHSSEWPDDLDLDALAGQRVLVVGSGASANQIVPAIADHVGSLTILQRTAQWARPIPRYHDAIPAGSQWLFEHLPFYAAWFRFAMLWRYGDGLLPYLRKDPDWPRTDSINRVNERHRQEMFDHIDTLLGDRPDVLAAATPTYPPYGKRIVLDNGWFDALTKPNVTLVPEAAASLTSTGVIDALGVEHPADIVVFATGFEVFQGPGRLGIVGRDGQTLASAWADDDPRPYLGITAPGFPNLFFLQGPTTGLGHGGSAIFQAECQARYITSCLGELRRRGARCLEPRPEVAADYNERFDRGHDELIWTHHAMKPWYRNDAGRVVAVMPWRLVDYWSMTHDIDPSDFVFDPA